MKRFVAANLIIIVLLCVTAQAGISAQAGQQRLSLTLKDVSFPEAISQILAGSAISYSVYPSLGDLKVSAKLKNVTRDQALKVVCTTAGVVFKIEDKTYLFSPKPTILSKPGPGTASEATKGPAKIGLIKLSYILAGDASALLNASAPDGLMSITATSANTIMLKGTAESIAEAQQVIKLFDVETALPRSVRIRLDLKVNASGLQKPLALSTESVGPEGTPMPLDINASTGKSDSYMLTISLTPTILPDGSVSLTGSGGIDCNLSNEQRVSRLFNVAAPATSGIPTVIASGSAESVAGGANFELTATVVIEKGRVASVKGDAPIGAKSAPSAPQSTASAAVKVVKPDQAHVKAADALLQQVWDAAPGQPKFDAVDAVARKYKEADMATRNAIGWLCVTYMNDKGRPFEERWPCCYVIGRSGYEPGVPELISVLFQDNIELMRGVAAEALGGIDSPVAHDALVRAEQKETSKRVREVIAKYVNTNER